MNSESTGANRDPLDPGSEANASANETPGNGSQGTPADPAKDDLSKAVAEAELWRDRYLRKAADYENYRKRCDRERADSANIIKGSVLAEFLPILDACERALKSFNGDTAAPAGLQKYREGVELLYKQVGDTLARLGVGFLDAKGQKFDPHFHEALAHLETMEYEDNTVIEELRKGYTFKERLLRPSQVIVASRPKSKKNEDEAEK